MSRFRLSRLVHQDGSVTEDAVVTALVQDGNVILSWEVAIPLGAPMSVPLVPGVFPGTDALDVIREQVAPSDATVEPLD